LQISDRGVPGVALQMVFVPSARQTQVPVATQIPVPTEQGVPRAGKLSSVVMSQSLSIPSQVASAGW
jgi:hypothetical protein